MIPETPENHPGTNLKKKHDFSIFSSSGAGTPGRLDLVGSDFEGSDGLLWGASALTPRKIIKIASVNP